MRPRAHEHHGSGRACSRIQHIDQQEIAADVAFLGYGSFAFERVVAPFGADEEGSGAVGGAKAS